MFREYKNLVHSCLKEQCYPVLLDYVIIEIYYKVISPDSDHRHTTMYEANYGSPEVVFEREQDPFKLVYLSGEKRRFCVHKVDVLESNRYATNCIRVKLYRSSVNEILKLKCLTFEEEIYQFIAHLNFDVVRIRELLGLTFVKSTRFLPQYIRMWVETFETKRIETCCINPNTHCFGPSSTNFLETRIVNGKLSACSSREELLSLNDDLKYKPNNLEHHVYNMHYSIRWKAVIPLAYNPFENPII